MPADGYRRFAARRYANKSQTSLRFKRQKADRERDNGTEDEIDRGMKHVPRRLYDMALECHPAGWGCASRENAGKRLRNACVSVSR